MSSPSPSCGPLVSEKVTAPLCVIIFFSVLNGMMFNVAIPDISAEYDLLPSQVSWVMTGYILLFGLGSLVYGKLSDDLPVRSLITLGLFLLNFGSAVGLFSTGYGMLIFARVIQASGGAAIPALAMLVATRYLPVGIRGRVLGLIASTVALAAAVGPILGGFVAGRFHWRFLFLIIMASALALPSLRRLLPREKARKVRFDTPGALLLGGTLALLLVAVTTGSKTLLLPGIAGAVSLVVHLRRAANPLLPPDLFLNRSYRTVAAVTVLAVGSIFGMMFMVPIMLRNVNGADATVIGMTLFPGAIGAALLGTVGGRVADRRGSAFVASAGIFCSFAGFLLLSIAAGMPPVPVAAALVVCYAGFAFLQSSLPHSAASSLPPRLTGVGMGTYNLIFFISGAFSASLIGRVLDTPPGGICLNPLAFCGEGTPYSNILVVLSTLSVIALWIFRRGYSPEVTEEELEEGRCRS